MGCSLPGQNQGSLTNEVHCMVIPAASSLLPYQGPSMQKQKKKTRLRIEINYSNLYKN